MNFKRSFLETLIASRNSWSNGGSNEISEPFFPPIILKLTNEKINTGERGREIGEKQKRREGRGSCWINEM